MTMRRWRVGAKALPQRRRTAVHNDSWLASTLTLLEVCQMRVHALLPLDAQAHLLAAVRHCREAYQLAIREEGT
jgi:hypothetical protein